MNYLEKLGIDLTTAEGLGKLTLLTCDDLPCGEDGICELGTRIFYAKERSECKAKHLLAEVPMKKRWELIKSDEDVERFSAEFRQFCKEQPCMGCKYDNGKITCFAGYLLDEVEE